MGGANYLVLDQGSHASKALVFAADGRVIASGEAPIRTHQPQPGWVEHDPDEIVASLHDAIAAALGAIEAGAAGFAAAGLAIQRSSIVCWDRENGAALSPVLSWQDRRNADWLRAQQLDGDHLREITGLVASPHYGASKLRWCLDHLPEVRRALAEGRLCCGPLASFVLHRLLDERPCLADPANASRTLLWDVRAHDWSVELLEACGIPRACLPASVPSRHAFGTLVLGDCRVPLEVMTGDQPAALFAWGAPDAGTLFVNIGTGAFVQRVFAGEPPDAPGLLRGIAWQDAERSIGVLEGTVNGAGAALAWLANERGVAVEALISGAARWLKKIHAPPLFINGVGGLGAPYWVADCTARFSGAGGLAEETVAVLESIVFLLQVNIEAIEAASAAGAGAVRRIIVSGGVARLDGLCQRLADLAGVPVERPADIEATARGVAWLLGVRGAAGDGRSSRFVPRPDQVLRGRFVRWRAALEASVAGLVAAGREA
ncbi:MAG: FGGY family carbohydrate kinase [Gammaproteobacteria bacterium]